MGQKDKLPFEFFDLNEITSYTRGVPSVMYGRRADGSLVAIQVDDNGVLSSGVSFSGGDIEIGAVELKDATTDNRANILSVNESLSVPGTPVGTVANSPIGSVNAFFADNTTDAVSNSWVSLPFGFSSFSMTVINDDVTLDLYISFDGVNTHLKLKPGDGQTMDYRRQSGIWLQSSAVGPIEYRAWAY